MGYRIEKEPVAFPQTKKDEYLANIRKSSEKNPELGKLMLKKVEEADNFFPDKLPLFSEIVIDGEGNALVFDFSDDKELYFSVYSTHKGKIGSCRFVSNEIVFPLGVRQRVFHFHQSEIYALAAYKSSPNELRLFKLKPVVDN